MKKLPLSGLVVWLTATACGQGQLILDNLANTSTNPFATSNGLFWLLTAGTPVLINQDFNAAFYAGTDSSSLSLLATFLLSNGTAIGDNSFGPGTFVDPSGKNYGFPSTTTVFVEIQAWIGNFSSYAAALSADALTAQSPIFVNRVDVPPGPAADLTGMPAMVLAVPEPSTFVLGGVGCLCALLLCRCRRSTYENANS